MPNEASGLSGSFGINGFIIGPTIAAMFIAVWHLQFPAANMHMPDDPSQPNRTGLGTQVNSDQIGH